MYGNFKIQLLDLNGFYIWKSKLVNIDSENSILEIICENQHHRQNVARNYLSIAEELVEGRENGIISLLSASYAKVWQNSSDSVSFGFDLIWKNGKIWNFICDNFEIAEKFSQAINDCISGLLQYDPSSIARDEFNLNNNMNFIYNEKGSISSENPLDFVDNFDDFNKVNIDPIDDNKTNNRNDIDNFIYNDGLIKLIDQTAVEIIDSRNKKFHQLKKE